MKFSYNWMRELVPGLKTSPQELMRLITMKTAECEGLERVGEDSVIEVDNKSLTHRPDLWGHHGMAREVAAITGNALRDPVSLDLLPRSPADIAIEIEDFALCPRYSALVFENVTVADSPAWLRERLEAIGLNAINNIVDVTNYVMAELAQPMHAFDSDKLHGNTIFVRSRAGGRRDRRAQRRDLPTAPIESGDRRRRRSHCDRRRDRRPRQRHRSRNQAHRPGKREFPGSQRS